MSFDFAAVLVLLVAVSGAIWAFDAWRLAPRRRASLAALPADAEPSQREAAGRLPVAVDYARSFFPIFLIVLLLRSFLAEPFRIPSGSMMPTLLVGDFILVNKFGYGIRLPVVNLKVLPLGAPERGDVVVFRYPEDPSTPYIKRVVGIPGDRVRYVDKILYVNGREVTQDGQGVYVGAGAGAGSTGALVREEDLSGVRHRILITEDAASFDVELTVPDESYFVMGDNRDNSRDSRYWGFVPDRNLVGRAFVIWMNWDFRNAGWRRIGTLIR
ncbi:MAG: signal peptidase I [Gammaproteobacteria bacterium]